MLHSTATRQQATRLVCGQGRAFCLKSEEKTLPSVCVIHKAEVLQTEVLPPTLLGSFKVSDHKECRDLQVGGEVWSVCSSIQYSPTNTESWKWTKNKSLKIYLNLPRPFRNIMTRGKAWRSLYCIAYLIVSNSKRRFLHSMFLIVNSRRWTRSEGKQQSCEQSCCQASRCVIQTSCEWKGLLYSFLLRSAVPAETECRCVMTANKYFTVIYKRVLFWP